MRNRRLPALGQLHSLVNSPGGIIALTIALMVFQHTFQLDFICPCDDKQNKLFGVLYFVLPLFIMIGFVLVIGPDCKRNCRSSLPPALLIATVWIITALIDGDILVCLLAANKTTDGRQIACVQRTGLSPEEQRNINYYVNESRMIGFAVIGFLLIVCAVIKFRTQVVKGTATPNAANKDEKPSGGEERRDQGEDKKPSGGEERRDQQIPLLHRGSQA